MISRSNVSTTVRSIRDASVCLRFCLSAPGVWQWSSAASSSKTKELSPSELRGRLHCEGFGGATKGDVLHTMLAGTSKGSSSSEESDDALDPLAARVTSSVALRFWADHGPVTNSPSAPGLMRNWASSVSATKEEESLAARVKLGTLDIIGTWFASPGDIRSRYGTPGAMGFDTPPHILGSSCWVSHCFCGCPFRRPLCCTVGWQKLWSSCMCEASTSWTFDTGPPSEIRGKKRDDLETEKSAAWDAKQLKEPKGRWFCISRCWNAVLPSDAVNLLTGISSLSSSDPNSSIYRSFLGAMSDGNSAKDGLDDSMCKGSEVETVLSSSEITTPTDCWEKQLDSTWQYCMIRSRREWYSNLW